MNSLVATTVGLACAAALLQTSGAPAIEIDVLCSTALKGAMEELIPQFEVTTKHKVVVKYGPAALLKQQIDRGEPFDVAVLTPAVVDEVIRSGKIDARTRTSLARTPMAIAMRAGAPRRDIGTIDALTRTLLDARSIAYATEGAGGQFFIAFVQRLGIAAALSSSIKGTTTGQQVGEAIVNGEAELGILPLSEIRAIRGVDALGTFPAAVQGYATMVAGVGIAAKDRKAAGDLIAFLTTPAASRVMAGKGLERYAAALVPYIDVHTHLDNEDAAVDMARESIKGQNAARVFFMPAPHTVLDGARRERELMKAAAANNPDTFAFLGGGDTLNAMIQEAVHTGDAGPRVRRAFTERANAIVRDGALGFGEMTAQHFAGGTPYQYAPADHPLFLLLADIAAQRDVVIDLHLEAVPQGMRLPPGLKSPPNPPELHANVAPFERLLSRNPRARIVWAHAGSDNTGYRTPDLCRRLLAAHPNLFMQIKVDPANPGANCPIEGDTGRIEPEWLRLFQDFPDRFVVGSDQHYPMPAADEQRWQASVLLLNQLSDDLKRKIGFENAMRIYRIR